MKMIVFATLAHCFLFTCKNQQASAGTETERAPGRYFVTCLKESLPEQVKVDTAVVATVTKDSVYFSSQRLANCCGWFDSLSLQRFGDTLRLVDNDVDGIRSACDCNCLFEETIAIDRVFLDSVGRFLEWRGRLLSHPKD